MNFPQNATNPQKGLVQQYVAYFVEKKYFLLIFIPFYWFNQIICLNKSKFSSGFFPFQTW